MVKVADFGLSRDIFCDDYYVMEEANTPLPVKWMALESIKNARFSIKSDVVRILVFLKQSLTVTMNSAVLMQDITRNRRVKKHPIIIVCRMEFDKTWWSCPWNSNQNCTQNSARGGGVKGLGCWVQGVVMCGSKVSGVRGPGGGGVGGWGVQG